MGLRRFVNIIAIPAFACLTALLFWGKEIESYSQVLYWGMAITYITAMIASHIQTRREHDQAIADDAVERYKQETGQK